MQNVNEIRRHIAAVEQTRKITDAMYLIASARIRKARRHMAYDNLYFSRVQAVMKDILMSSHPVTSPYLTLHNTGKSLYVVVAGDKGMAGAYNSTVLDFAWDKLHGRDDCLLYTVGLVAGDYFRHKGLIPDREIAGLAQDPNVNAVRDLILEIMERFDAGELRSVYILYTPFSNHGSETPLVRRILPVRSHDYETINPTEEIHDMEYRPSADEVFARMMPWYLTGLTYGALVQAHASEHLARMNAMQSATRNADELLQKLRLQYNSARQAAITQEISEITGAAAAIAGQQQ